MAWTNLMMEVRGEFAEREYRDVTDSGKLRYTSYLKIELLRWRVYRALN